MSKKRKEESSSSEDEACIEALKEAADQDFLKHSFFTKEENSSKVSNNEVNNTDEKVDSENFHDFENHGLSQSCRDYIAKKLNERLKTDVILEDCNIKPELVSRDDSDELSGIKLLTSSNIILTKVEEPIESQILTKRKKVEVKYNEKLNLLKCKEVAVDPEKIISQHETKFWTDRKIHKPFRYKKLKNGKLLEIN